MEVFVVYEAWWESVHDTHPTDRVDKLFDSEDKAIEYCKTMNARYRGSINKPYWYDYMELE